MIWLVQDAHQRGFRSGVYGMPTDKEVGIRRIPAYTLHYTTASSLALATNTMHQQNVCVNFCTSLHISALKHAEWVWSVINVFISGLSKQFGFIYGR